MAHSLTSKLTLGAIATSAGAVVNLTLSRIQYQV